MKRLGDYSELQLSNSYRLGQSVYKYRLSKHDEVKAFKVALMYEKLLGKICPSEKKYGLKGGDPRSNYLFQICLKVVNDLRGKLVDKDFRSYIEGNIFICNSFMAYVGPRILLGDKAWSRYLVFKSKVAKELDKQNR